MTELINQIVDIAKNIAHIFIVNILDPLILIFKSIGTLFVKVLELVILAVKWIVAQV